MSNIDRAENATIKDESKTHSKATSSLFLSKMTAKLDKTLMKNYITKQGPNTKLHTQWEQQQTMNQQQQNWTAAKATG